MDETIAKIVDVEAVKKGTGKIWKFKQHLTDLSDQEKNWDLELTQIDRLMH